MANKYSPGITFEEKENTLPTQPIEESMIVGGLIATNWGEGDKVIDLYTVPDLVKYAGEPNDYNYKEWYGMRDYLIGNKQLKMVRAIPTNAQNSSIKLKGISHLLLSTWYTGTTGKDLEKISEDFYNSEVAEFNLDQVFTTTSKLQLIHKYVTSKQTLAVAVCSNANHYEQPIFNEHIRVIRAFDWYQEPSNPVKYEKYKLTRASMTITDTDAVANTITVSGDYSSLAVGTEMYIVAAGLTESASFRDIITATYSVATDSTVIAIDSITENDKTGTATYLTGANWRVNSSTYVDGAVLEYSGSAWTVFTPTNYERYYISNIGQVWYYNGAAWVQDPNANYLPVDTDRDGKHEYAVKNIFEANMYNSDNSLKTFKDVYKENLDFTYKYDANGNINSDDCLVFVFQLDESDNKWYLKEKHYGSYLLTSRDENNKPNNIERVIFEDSDLIYAKIGEVNEYTAASTDSVNTLTVTADLRNLQSGDKLNYTDWVLAATDVSGTFTISTVTYSAPTTTIVVTDDLTGYTVDAGSKIDDTYAGKVSTNRNIYSDPYHASYDIANKDASDGFPLMSMLIYDTAPVNSSNETITDYSDLEYTDMNSSADVFLDKDNVDVDLLLPFETIDDFGNHTQDKMADIASIRERCYAIVVPFDETLFLGYTKEQIQDNLIEQFGNQRSSLYSGTFTKFGKYAGVDTCTMKYIEDTYNNKYRWVPLAGDIARMTVNNDYDPTKGVWTPIANENGEINNAIKLSYIPTETQREELNKNGINTVFKNPKITYPRIFSNLTSYRSSTSLFRIRSVRMMINKIENYINDNVFPLYFKFKEDRTYKRLRDSIDPFLQKIVIGGGLTSASLIFPEIVNEPSDTITLYLKLGIAGVVEKFHVIVEMNEQGVINITENVV